MAALAVGVYDDFVSDTLQSQMSDLRVLDENEVELVSGQGAVLIGVTLLVVGVVIGVGVGFWINRDPPYEPERPPPPPPSPPRWEDPNSYWQLRRGLGY
jgi:hypothetical protein